VILADEADNKRIRIHPALQAAGNSNLKAVKDEKRQIKDDPDTVFRRYANTISGKGKPYKRKPIYRL
jgi:hypothetical protein